MQEWISSILKAKEGDLAAFDLVVKEFQDMAVGYAYTILQDFHLAEDAAQEAFVEAYYGLKSLQEIKAFPAWFRKIVFRQCNRITRGKQLPTLPLDNVTELTDPAPTPPEIAERGEIRSQVLAAINSLAENERIVTTLACINGYSLAEVGDFLEVPVTTVKNRLHSARKQLRERMIGLVEETLKQCAPGDDFSKRVAKVLDGIDRTHWETTGALCFTGSVLACMRYLGEPMTQDYVMGISGGAFKLFWHPEWSPGNCDLLMYGEEPVRRAFTALGYDYTYLPDYDRQHPVRSKEFYQKQIVKSIDQGKPVLAIGIIGPPECCVIAGYDRDGEVVYGRSYFQGSVFSEDNYVQEATGYYRTDQWFENFFGLICIGEKKPAPSKQNILRQSLEWAIRLAKEPEFIAPNFIIKEGMHFTTKKHISGLAAYDAIISALERDEDFPEDDPDILSFRCMALGGDGVHLLGWKRYAAMLFLNSMADDDTPYASDLKQASNYYGQEAGLVKENYMLVPDYHMSEDARREIADPNRRREIIGLVWELKSYEEKAVQCIEKVYKVLAQDRK